jgi:hypothetical protein
MKKGKRNPELQECLKDIAANMDKRLIKEFNAVTKIHLNMKHLLSEVSHDIALLKAINKHEKETQSRPEEVYMTNVKKRLDRNLTFLRNMYIVKPKQSISSITEDYWSDSYVDIDKLYYAIHDELTRPNIDTTLLCTDLINWLDNNKHKKV